MSTEVFFNELHYDTSFILGIDIGEGFEIAGPAGTDLQGWKVFLYGGKDGKVYREVKLKGLIPSLQNGYGTSWFSVSGIRNGPDGLALVDSSGKVRQFLSYEGQFVAKDGPANGQTSNQIPLAPSSFKQGRGKTLQLQGEGTFYEDFKWSAPQKNTQGKVNTGQTFKKRTTPKPEPHTPSTQPFEDHHETWDTTAPDLNGPKGTLDNVDLQLAKNRTNANTDRYHSKEMAIFRRGTDFEIKLNHTNGVILAQDIKVTLIHYPESNQSIQVKVDNFEDGPNKLCAWVTRRTPNSTFVSIRLPGDSIIGNYKLRVAVGTKVIDNPIVVLLNPWYKEDNVFLPDPAGIDEYVLNDDGLIWVGSRSRNSPRAWNFAQFNTKSLQASLTLLEKMPLQDRKDSALIARAMSALVNVQDEGGVLVGNWSGKFEDGTAPTVWTGSAEILKQFLATGKAVKYGQCWVFAGVVCTVCRALGMPARVVTNFDSAHDTSEPYNRAVDKYYDKNMKLLEDKCSDSIWNFHVWNDVWMRRPDLGIEYVGWQAIDATPQETSEGKYQTGPCPVLAIKNGSKNINYDLEFIFSEVNADICHWVENDAGEFKLVRIDTRGVGTLMATKAPNRNALHEVSGDYKYPEGSLGERAAHGNVETDVGDVDFSFSVPNNTKLGDDIAATLVMKKKSSGNVNVSLKILHTAVSYHGTERGDVKSIQEVVSVSSSGVSKNYGLKFSDYQAYLKDDFSLSFKVFAAVDGGKQTFFQEIKVNFDLPVLRFDLIRPVPLTVGADGVVRVSFINPLPIALTKVKLVVEGQSLTKIQGFELVDIPPKGKFQQSVNIHAWERDAHFLIGTLSTAEVSGIRGQIELFVE